MAAAAVTMAAAAAFMTAAAVATSAVAVSPTALRHVAKSLPLPMSEPMSVQSLPLSLCQFSSPTQPQPQPQSQSQSLRQPPSL